MCAPANAEGSRLGPQPGGSSGAGGDAGKREHEAPIGRGASGSCHVAYRKRGAQSRDHRAEITTGSALWVGFCSS